MMGGLWGLEGPDGDRFMVIGEDSPENFVLTRTFSASSDRLTSSLSKYQHRRKHQGAEACLLPAVADELNRRLSVRREDVFISLVFVDRDWSFGNGEPW